MRNNRRIDCSFCTKSHSESVGQAANSFHSFFTLFSGPLHSLASQFFRRSFIAGVKFAWLLVRFSWMKPVVTQLPISSTTAMQSIGWLSALLPFFCCHLHIVYCCSYCRCCCLLVAWQTEIVDFTDEVRQSNVGMLSKLNNNKTTTSESIDN